MANKMVLTIVQDLSLGSWTNELRKRLWELDFILIWASLKVRNLGVIPLSHLTWLDSKSHGTLYPLCASSSANSVPVTFFSYIYHRFIIDSYLHTCISLPCSEFLKVGTESFSFFVPAASDTIVGIKKMLTFLELSHCGTKAPATQRSKIYLTYG